MLSAINCRIILIALLIGGGSVSSFGQNIKIKKDSSLRTILFVCEHGAGRSTIAATYFNKIAEKQGLKYHAIFRGVDPQEALGKSTKDGLIKDGVDVTNLIPTKLSKNDINNAYKVITLDVTLPDTLNKADITWIGIQMAGNYGVSKTQIALKVDSLITILTTKKK
jgi:galactitol-specific phosphotransferase system IIB component